MSEHLHWIGLHLVPERTDLDIEILDLGDEMLVRLAGEADCATESSLQHALAAAVKDTGAQTVTLDVRWLSFLSAGCGGLIARTAGHLRGESRQLVVRAPTPIVRLVLEVCGLAPAIASTVDDLWFGPMGRRRGARALSARASPGAA